MYTISFGDPMNDLLRLGGQAFPILLREGAGHLFAAIRSLKEQVTARVICCKPQERFDDYKLTYYVNMGIQYRQIDAISI
jgi:hypothetical protein